MRAGHREGAGAERIDRQSEHGQGDQRRRVDRISAKEFRQDPLRHAGQRHDVAPDVRAVSADGQGEATSHPLSRLGTGAAGPCRRRSRCHVRQSWRLAAAGPGRQAEAARSRLSRSAGGPAGRTDDRRDAAWLSGARMVWDRGAAQYAKSRYRQDQCRRERGVAPSRGAGSTEETIRGNFWRLDREDIAIYAKRGRAMGRRDRGGKGEAAVRPAAPSQLHLSIDLVRDLDPRIARAVAPDQGASRRPQGTDQANATRRGPQPTDSMLRYGHSSDPIMSRPMLALLLFVSLLFSAGAASAQDKGSVSPKPLPPLANPNDPKLGAKELFARKVLPAAMPTRVIGSYV